MIFRKAVAVAAMIFASVLLGSCNVVKDREISVEPENPVELTPGIQWAVINTPYAGFRKEPSFSSEVIFHARKGEIFQISGKALEQYENEDFDVPVIKFWYKLDEGWLEETSVMIYDNKFMARTAAERILQK